MLNTNDLVPNLYIIGPDGTKLAIDAIASIDSSTVIPLSLHITKSGLVDLTLVSAENLPFDLSAYLYDAKTNTSTKFSVGI